LDFLLIIVVNLKNKGFFAAAVSLKILKKKNMMLNTLYQSQRSSAMKSLLLPLH